MSLLTDADIESMRTTALEALPGTAVIQNQTFVDNGGGGGSLSWTASGTVACRLAPLTGDEREVADRISAEADYVITLPTTASVTASSRLIVAGGTFEVQALRDRLWNVTQRVEVARVT